MDQLSGAFLQPLSPVERVETGAKAGKETNTRKRLSSFNKHAADMEKVRHHCLLTNSEHPMLSLLLSLYAAGSSVGVLSLQRQIWSQNHSVCCEVHLFLEVPGHQTSSVHTLHTVCSYHTLTSDQTGRTQFQCVLGEYQRKFIG